jgi:chromosome segregation ATPase
MVLIHENDSLHAEIRSQAKLIQSLSDKLHLATRNSNLANEELEGTTDQIVEMQDRLNEYEYKLREAEGRVRKAVDEVDEKDGELERVGGTAKKMELEIEALTAKNNELLK